MILLDTCVVSETVRPRPDPRVLAWLAARRDTPLFTSVLTLGELRNGVGRLAPGARRGALEAWIEQFTTDFADRMLPVTSRVAARWGELTSAAARRGRSVAAVDGLIAATALEHGFVVATRNTVDFDSTGVRTVDPWLVGG
jgi:predicted nucleic acid-binding protein